MTVAPLRLAMWSGPRNISTAMMRAWENRADCAVVDEPLYAHYLAHTGLEHPGRGQILAAGETDWRRAVDRLLGPVPDGRAIFFQKHMTHHLLPHIDRGWCAALRHVFLIRDPCEVLLSYVRSRPQVCAEDIGVTQEHALHQELAALTGSVPPVIDADDFLRAPEAHLRTLCAWLGIDFSDAMLHWPAHAAATASGRRTGTKRCCDPPDLRRGGRARSTCRRSTCRSWRHACRPTWRCTSGGC